MLNEETLNTVPIILDHIREECLNTEFSPINWGDWTMMTKATYGWTEGLVWIAGKPNHGKSTFLINMVIRALENNPKLYILDFTMDDDLTSRVSRYISVKKNIDVNDVKREGFVNDPELVNVITEGYDWIKQFTKLSIYDANWMVEHSKDKSGSTVQNVCRYVTESYQNMRENDKNAEMLIVIDAFNDLDTTAKYSTENEKEQKVALELANLSRNLGCRILATGHVLKHIQMSSATQDVMAGHRYLQYNAKGIMLVYHTLKEDPNKTEALWRDPKSHTPVPVISLRFAKNKMSSSNNYQFFGLYENSGKMVYLPENQQLSYANILK